jgi:hypothetical protein
MDFRHMKHANPGCLVGFRFLTFQQSHHFPNTPNMIRDSAFHRWRHAQGLMDSAEIVVHKPKCNCGSVVFNLLGESICKPRETPNAHFRTRPANFPAAPELLFLDN